MTNMILNFVPIGCKKKIKHFNTTIKLSISSFTPIQRYRLKMAMLEIESVRNSLTGVMVEEPVLSAKHLGWLHDDGLRKLIPHCSLTDSLDRERRHDEKYAKLIRLIHTYTCVCLHQFPDEIPCSSGIWMGFGCPRSGGTCGRTS